MIEIEIDLGETTNGRRQISEVPKDVSTKITDINPNELEDDHAEIKSTDQNTISSRKARTKTKNTEISDTNVTDTETNKLTPYQAVEVPVNGILDTIAGSNNEAEEEGIKTKLNLDQDVQEATKQNETEENTNQNTEELNGRRSLKRHGQWFTEIEDRSKRDRHHNKSKRKKPKHHHSKHNKKHKKGRF